MMTRIMMMMVIIIIVKVIKISIYLVGTRNLNDSVMMMKMIVIKMMSSYYSGVGRACLLC